MKRESEIDLIFTLIKKVIMINENLSMQTFNNERESVRLAFGQGTVRVVTLPAGFKLFKLTKGEAEAGEYGVTGWWSPVNPYEEDDEGALGRYVQAKLNKIDMSSMVRYMSAVCIDWNSLDNYVEVKMLDSIKCYWGTFAPQKKWNDARNKDLGKEMRVSSTMQKNRSEGIKDAMLPNELGVLESWQFYIPNLTDDHIERSSVMPAHDMHVLGMHFGFI